MIRNNAGHHTPLRYVSGLPYLEQRPPTKDEMTNNKIPHAIMTREGVWNPRVVDDIESAEEMMKHLPTMEMEATDLFYNDHGDIDLAYIRNNYNAKTNAESIKTTSVRWNPIISETND